MGHSFNCYGHGNIAAKHKTTLEFTKDKDVSLSGDCIVGVKADFSLTLLKKFIGNKIKANKKDLPIIKKPLKKNKNSESLLIPIKVIIKIADFKEEISGFLNIDFNDENEIVLRKSNFVSERTLVFGADKAACGLKKAIKEAMKNPISKMLIVLE